MLAERTIYHAAFSYGYQAGMRATERLLADGTRVKDDGQPTGSA